MSQQQLREDIAYKQSMLEVMRTRLSASQLKEFTINTNAEIEALRSELDSNNFVGMMGNRYGVDVRRCT